MSVGHIARVFDSHGIATVTFGVKAFMDRMVAMNIPRLVITPELMGRTLGKPHDVQTQRKYLEAGLELLESATEGNSLVEIN